MEAPSEALFQQAAEHLKGSKVKLSDDEQLRLYALFKQATVGKCNTTRPGMLDFVGKAKWDAWNALGPLPQPDARTQYVAHVSQHCPSWRETAAANAGGEGEGGARAGGDDDNDDYLFDSDSDEGGGGEGGGSKGGFMAPGVSTLMAAAPPTGAGAGGGASDLCTHAADGDEGRVLALLDQGISPDYRDSDGQTALHFAADAGHLGVIKLLIGRGASVGTRAGDGQTPLHCACASDCLEACELLLEAGADPGASDADGVAPIDLCGKEEVRTLLIGAKLKHM